MSSWLRSTPRALATVCLLWCVSLTALAQDASSDEVARGLFQAGRASYDAGKYEDALKYFQQAYDLSQRPGLLYNIGQAADRLHQDQKTIEAFRLYLERVPDAENRAEVEGRLRTLERLVELEAAEARQREAQAQAQAPTDDANAQAVSPVMLSDDARDSGSGIAPWIVIGGGGAVFATGLVLTIVGTGQIADVEDAPRGTMFSEVRSSADNGPTLATVGVVMMTLGVAGAAAGVVWMLHDGGQERTQLVLGPGSVTITGSL